MPEIQTKNKLDKITMQKIGKGALIAMSGAGIIYILGAIAQIDFGPVYTPAVVGIAGILVNAVKEYMKGQSINPTEPIA